MISNLAYKIFGSSNERALKQLAQPVHDINALEGEYEKLSDSALQAKTEAFRARLKDGTKLENLMVEAFATVREAAKRTLGQRHFDVQLMGGITLHDGKIAEMKTGEGKTLVSTLAVYLNALEGKGVHVVTVNDYLAERDANWMRPIYAYLGLTVGCIQSNMMEEDRRAAYAADITYGTNNEFGFDYLRDNMNFRLEDMVQRPFNYAIIDEVDSILIDEARTPLIISGPAQDSSELYIAVDKVILRLEETDYELDEKARNVTYTEAGIENLESLLKEDGILVDGGLYDAQNISLVHHANQALRAHTLFQRDKDYIVKDDKVIIIDEFTGRMMEGRRFSEGLHQALEAKENVSIQNENQTLASITFQNYFRLYPKLAGMTGTALTEASEFDEIYNLGVIAIPTNKEMARLDHNDEIYLTMDEKFEAIIKLVKDCRDHDQPVLVGTTSIEKSEILSKALKKENIKHNVLNARYHEQEAHIIAQAGRPGAVTIATNMAGRGTDIQLGGNLAMRLMDEIPDNADESTRQKMTAKITAEIKEDQQRVKDSGGLFVIGTERHESRRIDNQLRGRSGRQGDPGASKFFLSLEDDLMRVFGPHIDAIMSRVGQKLGMKRGESITHPWINKAIERAQAKVEAQHFEIRKEVLKYDDVMNDQRKVIYEQRQDIMASEDVSDIVTDMRHEYIEDLVARCIPLNSYAEQWDLETLKSEAQPLLGPDNAIDAWAKEEGMAETELIERFIEESDKRMAKKATDIGAENFRKIEKAILLQMLDQTWKEHLLNLDHMRHGIRLRAYGQKDPLNEYKSEAFAMFEGMLSYLREKVTQALSLIEFHGGPATLRDLLDHRTPQEMHETRADPALRGQQLRPPGIPDGEHIPAYADGRPMPYVAPDFHQDNPETWGKTPRNAPCPCGSGKKFKHCHGRSL